MALPSNSYRRGGDRYYGDEPEERNVGRMMEEIADEIESDVGFSVRVEADEDGVSPFVSIEAAESDFDRVWIDEKAREWGCRAKFVGDDYAEIRPT